MSRRFSFRGRPSGFWRTLGGGALLGGVIVLLVGALMVAPWLLTHRSSWPLERQFGDYAVSVAARLHAGDRSNPQTVDARTLERGQFAYTGSCAQCHGVKGDGKDAALGGGLFPPATKLVGGDSAEKSDTELFWITKHGLSFTAMPAFQDQYNDDAIWAIVAYIRSLQGKTAVAAPSPPAVPAPTDAQLAAAKLSSDPASRGAALYFANNCFQCHGPVGNTPGKMALNRMPQRDDEIRCAIRYGPNGMPAYSTARISDEDLPAVIAYLRTFTTAGAGQGAGSAGRPAGGGPPGRGAPGGGQPGGGPPGGGAPQPDRYSGTDTGDPPDCAERQGPPPGATSGSARPQAAASPSPTPAPPPGS